MADDLTRWRVTLTWPRTGRWLPRENGYLPYLLDRPDKARDAIARVYAEPLEVEVVELRPRTVRVVAVAESQARVTQGFPGFRTAAQAAVDHVVYAAYFFARLVDSQVTGLPEPVHIHVALARPDTTGETETSP